MTDRRALTALTLRNARCFGERTVSIPLHPRATVILGENGAGKSTITEALAALGDDDPEVAPVAPWRRGTDDGEVTLFEGPTAVATWTWSRDAGERFTRERTPLLFAYGPYRRVLRNDDRWRARLRDDLPSYLRRKRTATLRQPDARLLHDLREVLIFLWESRDYDPRARDAWTRLDDSLRAMNVGLDGVEVRIEDDRYVPRVIRQGLALALEELSDGYQSVLIVAFDLILRAVHLPAWYAGEARPVVVVDEIDLHLHPRWQRAVVRQLLALFPEVQFVFTTHAASVVQDAIDLDVGVVVLRERDGASVASELTESERAELTGAHVGSLLVDERLFGVASRLSPRFEEMERELTTLRARIESDAATRDDRRRVVELLDTLRTLMAKEEERRGAAPVLSEVARLQIAFVKSLAAKGVSP